MIRPILRGRDICRYSYHWANLWLICTHNGVKDKGITKIPRIDINDYPAVKKHLDKYWDRIQRRDDQGDTPYNLRNCAYWGDFFLPLKIVYGQFQDDAEYTLIESGIFISSNEYMIIVNQNYSIKCLLAFLNSNIAKWYLKIYTNSLGGNAKISQKSNFIKLPIACLHIEEQEQFNKLVDTLLSPKITKLDVKKINAKIDNLIYQMYGLTQEEISTIEQS